MCLLGCWVNKQTKIQRHNILNGGSNPGLHQAVNLYSKQNLVSNLLPSSSLLILLLLHHSFLLHLKGIRINTVTSQTPSVNFSCAAKCQHTEERCWHLALHSQQSVYIKANHFQAVAHIKLNYWKFIWVLHQPSLSQWGWIPLTYDILYMYLGVKIIA